MNHTALIEQLRDTQQALEKLLVLLGSAERDRFVSRLYQSRREYRRACEIAGKFGKLIEGLRQLNVSSRRELEL